MKRSEVNQIIRRAESFFRQCGYYLPPFAYWTAEDWTAKGPEAAEVVEARLGWDITDFGAGDFSRVGLTMFTVRNGLPQNWSKMEGKLYCEKMMVVEDHQVTPYHFHWTKMEDIINRGGGRLVIQVYNSTPDEKLDGTPVTISTDGVRRRLPAGVTCSTPGASASQAENSAAVWSANSRTTLWVSRRASIDRSTGMLPHTDASYSNRTPFCRAGTDLANKKRIPFSGAYKSKEPSPGS